MVITYVRYQIRIIIILLELPTIDPEVTSYDMTVEAGEQVELRCNASGRPTPSIQWERQGNALLPIGLEKVMVREMHSFQSINYPTAYCTNSEHMPS